MHQQPGNAPRAHEISATLSSSNILPEGTRRNKKRRLAFATEFADNDPLVHYNVAFAAALSESIRDSLPVPATPGIKLKIHRDTLPPEPRYWKDLKSHSFGKYFIQAARDEYAALRQRGTFTEVDRQESDRPLPLLWVFKYKFDTDGYLVKFKARICVRGDLQLTRNDNYAATLAVRVFRALMALAAAFDLEILQLDAVNAFLNSDIDEHVTVQWPPGFQQNNKILKLLKALYGLKQAPVLWYNHLVTILLQLGLQKVHGVNCVLTTSWLILFFYVDDIILLYRQEDQEKVNTLLEQLMQRLELRRLAQANWFLGIRILRDRNRRKIWLCQDSYIDKITARFNIDSRSRALTPLPGELPGPYEGTATTAEIYAFGSRIGSANFAAVTTRPDIAKACSILAQHLCNPGPEHLRAADRLLTYLARTKFYAIEYGL